MADKRFRQQSRRYCPALRSRAAGFTLLELVIVMSIIAIALTLVAPNLASTDSRVFMAQVRQASSALNYARRIAIVKSTPSVARFRMLDPDSASRTNPDRES
ncbi:MAG: type II secretion system protein, partial [Pseudohongiellaceae bacterium]